MVHSPPIPEWMPFSRDHYREDSVIDRTVSGFADVVAVQRFASGAAGAAALRVLNTGEPAAVA